MRLENLDSRQRAVVDAALHPGAKILVKGGPGTGKTTAALWAARSYLESSGDTSSRVLFLTFSRAAVSQITRRSPGVLAGCADRIEIMTFHGLAYQILRAFGRYAGHGIATPTIQSDTRERLLGRDSEQLTYNDLIPEALRILEGSTRIKGLFAARWGLVICDEAQDTSTDQWRFLRALASSRMLLLGDENQMIYDFLTGVSLEQFRQTREWVEQEIALIPQSHRDPSGAIPALAEAIRQRNFNDEAVAEAIRNERLTIYYDTNRGDELNLLCRVVSESRRQGSRNIGIFAHSNAAVADIAEGLSEAGVDYDLVGIPEAHAEALSAMATQCAFGLGFATSDDIRKSYALFVTASKRTRNAPEVAQALMGQGHFSLPQPVNDALLQLDADLKESANGYIEDLVRVAMQSWELLLINTGISAWQRAAAHFMRLAGPVRKLSASEDSVRRLLEIVERARVDALIDFDYSERGVVRLMNYHQTKGREADTVVHVFRSSDYFGKEQEPFAQTSRLLNVAISRARERVVVILPPNPHPLVEPFRKAIPRDVRWEQAVRRLVRVKGAKYNLGALLRDCRPSSVRLSDDGKLILPFTNAANFARMQEELDDPTVRIAVEQAIEQSFGNRHPFVVTLEGNAVDP